MPLFSSESTAAFSQMMWASSDRFGCGQAVSEGPKGGTWTVCLYDEPGNEEGEAKNNVNPPRNQRKCLARREIADKLLY